MGKGTAVGGRMLKGRMAVWILILCLGMSGCGRTGKGMAADAAPAGGKAPESAGSADGSSMTAPEGTEASESEGGTGGNPMTAPEGTKASESAGSADGGSVAAPEGGAEASGTVGGTGGNLTAASGSSDRTGEAGNGEGASGITGPSPNDMSETDGESAGASGNGTESSSAYDFTLCFAGDINLDENWGTTQFLDGQENGIYDCISGELVDAMRDADIMCLNNEFAYSRGGAPLEGKAYTFRAMPERVEVLHQLGVDAVTLANNHIYDYGKEALLDTFTVLEEAEVPYFGAGRSLEEACRPLYLEADGKTIALVGASRAEKNKMTPQATETEPGILRCYDTELFLESIREGKDNADFCIAFVHWGTEYSFDLEQVQLDTGKEYLDAGADAVIGAHSHCLQGMEYYDGKPIVYSLGNYWFNEKTLDTMLLQLHFSGDEREERLEVQVIPAVQKGYRTTYASEAEEQRRIYDFLEDISVNVEISDEGIVREAG